jgi:VIT1/CCC1 family predicted Fe2+/Mn2+ transporter
MLGAELHQDYLRSAIFGAEDGLVSTTGALAGIAAGTRDAKVVVTAGLVIVMVEALSMAAGQFLSERAVHQFDPTHRDSLAVGAAVMFVAYAAGGSVPLFPVLVLGHLWAVWLGTGLAFVGLFVLGWAKGRIVHVAPVRSGLEILAIGGLATVVGLIIGLVVRTS